MFRNIVLKTVLPKLEDKKSTEEVETVDHMITNILTDIFDKLCSQNISERGKQEKAFLLPFKKKSSKRF